MKSTSKHNKQTGVTLIELMITVVILSIVLAFAVPSYQQRVRESKRTDATTALLALSAEQEKYFLKNNTYGTTTQLGFTATEAGYYSIAITLDNNGGYAATARAQGSQIADTKCKSFTIDHTGKKTSTGAGDSDTDIVSNGCW